MMIESTALFHRPSLLKTIKDFNNTNHKVILKLILMTFAVVYKMTCTIYLGNMPIM